MGLADEVVTLSYPEAVQTQPLYPEDASYEVRRYWFEQRDILPGYDPVSGEIAPVPTSPPTPPREPVYIRDEASLYRDDTSTLHQDRNGYYAVRINGIRVYLD